MNTIKKRVLGLLMAASIVLASPLAALAADNISVTQGSGTTMATDDVGSAHYQRVKSVWGADGSVNDTSAAAPMPVTLSNVEVDEDAAHTTADPLLPVAAVRNDTPGALSGTDGDYTPLQTDDGGNLRVEVTANSGVDIGDVDVTSIVPGTGATNLGKAEDAAHSSADVGVAALGVVETTSGGTSATDGDYANITLNSDGAQRIQSLPHTTGGLSFVRLTDIDETEETVKGSAGMVYAIHLENTSTTAAVYVHLYDAASPDTSSTDSDVFFVIPAANAADEPRVLDEVFPFGIPFGTAITIGALDQIAASGSSGAGSNVVNGMVYYK